MVFKDHGKLSLFDANLEDTFAKTPPASFFLLFPYFLYLSIANWLLGYGPSIFCFRQKHYLSFKFVYEHNNFHYLTLQTINVQMKDEYISCIFSSLLVEPRHRFVHIIIFIFLQVVLFTLSNV